MTIVLHCFLYSDKILLYSPGLTALHSAAGGGHVDACKLLLDRGAVPGAKAKDGSTALSLAEEEGHAEVQALLVNPRSARSS